MRAIAARDKPCPGGALTVCPREGASKARLRLQIRAGSQAPPCAGGAPRSGATMSTRPDTLRRIRTQQSARHNPRHSPAETWTAVVVKPASVKRLRAHPSGAKGAAREAALRPRHVVHVPSTSHPCSPKGGIPGGVFGRRFRRERA
jgi:hypothetical protein